jgi:hypothetical protein
MNDNDPSENIEKFIQYFRNRLGAIKALDDYHFRCILYFSLIDTLSRVAYPEAKNHKRVTEFINNFSGWLYVNRVNTQQLVLQLEKRKLTTAALYIEATTLCNQCGTGIIRHPEHEQDKSKFEHLIKNVEESEALSKATYSELLYSLRNALIHELRTPGHGLNFDDNEDEPYHHSYNGPRQTVFPSAFLYKLASGCIEGLGKHLNKEKIDPYTRYNFSDTW